ncbi:MAG: twin transmembrane helix small protein [Ideonella sp.]
MKILVALAFAGILAALAYAGVSMIKDSSNGKTKKPNMMRALAVRVGLSVMLFVCLLLSYKMGWISPTGIPLK